MRTFRTHRCIQGSTEDGQNGLGLNSTRLTFWLKNITVIYNKQRSLQIEIFTQSQLQFIKVSLVFVLNLRLETKHIYYQMEVRQTHINLLSDKDYQLVSKIYRRNAEQFYENPQDSENLASLMCITSLIPEIVAVKAGLQSLTVISQMEILRAKTKGNMQLKEKLAFAIGHLKNPKSLPLSKKYLIEAFSKEQLYLLACTIALRYIRVLKEDCEMDWKIVINLISQNIDKAPFLTVQLLIEVCKQDQQNARMVNKSGIVKYIFVEYLQKNLKDKFNLYKGIKLIKVTSADRSVVRERQKTLGLIISTYENYIPAISEISSRCYDSEYCNIVVNRNIFQPSGIDYAFIWSYVQIFAKHQLNQDIIGMYLKLVSSQKVSSEMEAKVFAIFGNYCKFCKCVSKELLKITPKYQESLLFYLKMCFNMSEIDVSSPHYINWNQVNDLLLANSNPKAQEIANYLKDIMNTKARVGSLNPHFVRMFAVDRNADMLLDRAAKVPKSNEDLENIKSILKQKVGSNELDTDTLNLAKEKAIESIRRAVVLKRKIDINSILDCLDLGDIYQVSQFLKILEMYLTIFEDQTQAINKNRVLELIEWIQDHYTGQIIDWGSISQLLLILCSQDEWRKGLKNLSKYCFWILSIDQLTAKDQQKIWNTVNSWDTSVLKKKLPFVLGFLGKIYKNPQRANSCKKNIKSLESIVQNIAKSQDYNVNLMMLSYFLRGWGRDQEDYSHQKHKKTFEQLIKPVVNIITSHPRQSPQENYLLESCIPYKVDTSKVTTDLEGLLKTNGRLASQIYSEQSKNSKKVSQIKVSNLENESAGEIDNVLIFAQEHPNALKSDQINRLVRRIENQPNCYWQLFPRYMDIMTAIMDIVGQSENEHIKRDLSNITTSLVNEVISNPDITDDQRQELLEVTRDSFKILGERGAYLQIERIKTIVRKIVDQEIREEILIILNNYKIKEEPKVQIPLIEQFQQRSKMEMPSIAKKWLQNEDKRQLFQVQQQIQPKRSNQMNSEFTNEQNYFSAKSRPTEEVKPIPLESMFQSIKNSNNLSLVEAFEILKKITNKEHPNQKFNQIYEIFAKNPLSTYQKQILGILLSKLYNVYQCPKVLSLILDKQKTHFTQPQIFELVTQHVPAFALYKREKLLAREYLNVAMERVRQNFFVQGCEVAGYNLNQTSDLQYFYTNQYHNQVLELVQVAKQQDEIAQLLLLIGRAAKFPQIRNEWLSKNVHTRILKFIELFPKSIKIIGNLSFALSSLTNQQTEACSQIVKEKNLLYTYLQSVKIEPSNSNVANYASEFINNLSISKSFELIIFDIQRVISTLKILFASNIECENIAPYKYILKAIGFLSLTYSSDFLEEEFCEKIILFSEKLDIITSYDQKKGKITHLLIDLIINLSKNKEKRMMLHNHKITLLTVTLLETIESEHPEIIATCIDAINALCQESVIEKWYVIEKRLPFILLDILKLQSEETLVLKAMRMAHNITLNASCIPTILKSNILGVIANIVIPHIGLHRLSVENEQFCKKVELFIIKMIVKVYEAKPPLEQILKSGFLDCLVRLIEMSEVQENILDILFHYSPHIPNFLNRRTFSSLIKILTVKVTDRKALVKCLQSLRNILSFSYQTQQEDNIIQGISDMYLKFIATEFTEDALFLLFYHLMRSLKFRELLRSPQDKIQQQLLKLADQEKYKEICRTIIFLIYSPPPKMFMQMPVNTKVEGMQYETMRAGIRCWLYRADGSYKEAKIDIDQQYNFRVYKAPDGEIKSKYTTNIRHVRQFQIEFQSNKQLWSRSIFELQKGMFHSSKPENCCTLTSNEGWGNIKMINIEFLTYEDKIAFFTCFTYLLAIFRL